MGIRTPLDRALAVGGVCGSTFLLFLPVLSNGFVNWDDPFVFQHNPQLGAPGAMRWAFTTTLMGHYQPLSWLVWSAVTSWLGLNAWAFHLLSLIGHLLNSALVYMVCRRLALYAGIEHRPSRLAAVIAALLFAVHPIQVEAVAWASAFPYVLSLGLVLVAFLAYLTAAAREHGGTGRVWFGFSIAAYAASLLARANAVGFPIVLLAVDVFPLQRMRAPRATVRRLLVEKLPFFVLAIAAVAAESRAREVATLQEVGVGARLTMAAASPFMYVGRIFLPLGLSPLDPLPIEPTFRWTTLVLGATAMVAATAVAWKARRRWPAVPVVWIAYLMLLAPVLGLAPSGLQATADRYMYFPGVIVAVAVALVIARVRDVSRRTVVLGIAFILAAVLAVTTRQQIAWWRDSIALWSRAVDLDQQNDIATYNLAIALADAGREDEAIAQYERTLKLVPEHEDARHNLRLIRAARAEREGDRLAATGRMDEAVEEYARALTLDARRLHARAARGVILAQRGQFAGAVVDLRAAVDANVDDPEIANTLAFALMQTGQPAEAVDVLKHAIARYPDDLNLAHNLARLLVTSPDADSRDAEDALRLALEVRDRTGGRDPRALDTLAAAYAAVGRIDLARQTAAEAAALARHLGDLELAAEIERRLKRGDGQRWHRR